MVAAGVSALEHPDPMIQYVPQGIYDGEVIAEHTQAVVGAGASGLLPRRSATTF